MGNDLNTTIQGPLSLANRPTLNSAFAETALLRTSTPTGSERCQRQSTVPAQGDILFGGRYQVIRELGRGGQGVVFQVFHRELRCFRALKLIDTNLILRSEGRRRVQQEAKLMARVSHPNTVTVHDARMVDDVFYIEMELVSGQSLDKVLLPGQPLDLKLITRILEQLCDVLAYLHELGIIHRDVKPSNVMRVDGLSPGHEQIKVLDFGISKVLLPEALGFEELRTKTGCLNYTLKYASPEQLLAAPVDPRSDLYAVGLLLFEWLCGYPPFQGPFAAYKRVTENMPCFSQVNPSCRVPKALENLIIGHILARNPSHRPISARELWQRFMDAIA